LSFDLAHKRYKKQLLQMTLIGKSDEMATSQRYILQWMRNLEKPIQEQQKIAFKRGTLAKDKIGYYLMALPSETIATLCVSHLVKKLFQEFVDDMN